MPFADSRRFCVRPLWRRGRLACAGAVVAAVFATTVHPSAGVEDASAEILRAETLFERAKYREAVQAYLRARELNPDLALASTRAVVRALLRVGDFRQAADESALLSDLSVDAADTALRADALWSVGHFEEAAAAYSRALALAPNLAAANHGMARVLDARGRTAEALALVSEAIEREPHVPEYRHTRAYLLERSRNYQVAADELERYITLLPKNGFKDQIKLARARIKFLRHFRDREPLRMTPAVRDQVHVVPFRIENEKLFVKVRINDRWTRDLIVDTGAEMTVLSEDSARAARVYSVAETLSAGVGEVGLRRLKLARIASLEVGTLRVEHVPAMIKDPPLRRIPSQEIDAISPLALGLSMRVDYNRGELIMAKTLPPPETPANIEMPLWMHRLATVRGTVNGDRPAAFVVDTGGQAISISRTTAVGLEQLGRFRRIPLKVYGSSGWDRDAFLLPGVDLEVDDVKLARSSLVVLNLRAPSVLLGYEVGGILGHKFLSRYTVSLDLGSGRMLLHN
jgi:tetratricopeptide (TPR) repeat protein